MENKDTFPSGRILYIDEYLAVVYKRIGEICENAAENKALSLVENLREELELVAAKPLPELEAVHRIDQPVSGCVFLALDQTTLSTLSAEFAQGNIYKRYLAIVEKPKDHEIPQRGKLDHMIRFDHKHHKAFACTSDEIRKPGSDWKHATLTWILSGMGDRYAFLEIIPETGRSHQIRAQLAASGMCIKGDLKYGAKRSDPLGGIRLHAYSIRFIHPVTGLSHTIIAPLSAPDALWQAFERVLV